MDRIFNKDDYLIKHKEKDIFSIYPPKTATCLTPNKNSLNPSEYAWLWWTSYI